MTTPKAGLTRQCPYCDGDGFVDAEPTASKAGLTREEIEEMRTHAEAVVVIGGAVINTLPLRFLALCDAAIRGLEAGETAKTIGYGTLHKEVAAVLSSLQEQVEHWKMKAEIAEDAFDQLQEQLAASQREWTDNEKWANHFELLQNDYRNALTELSELREMLRELRRFVGYHNVTANLLRKIDAALHSLPQERSVWKAAPTRQVETRMLREQYPEEKGKNE